MVFEKNVIFDKDIIKNWKSILYFDNNIKDLNKIIVYIEIFKLKAQKMEDIPFVKDFKVDKKILAIIHQSNYKNKNLDINLKKSRK